MGTDTVDFGGAEESAAALEIKFAAFDELAASDDTPIKPERVIAELNRVAPSDAVIVAEPRHPMPVFFSVLSNSPRRATLHIQPGAWRSGLFPVGGGRRPDWTA